MKAIRYTIKDARSRYNLLDYVATLVLYVKNIEIINTEKAQVLLAYKYIDSELRLHLQRPQENSTISGLLEELRYLKDI